MSQRHSPRPPSVRALAEYQFVAFLGRDPMTESWEARTADGTAWLVRLVYGVNERISNEARARLAGRSHAAVQFPRIVSAGPACAAVVAEQVAETAHDRQLVWRTCGRPAPLDEILGWLEEAATVLDDLSKTNLPHLGLHPRCLGFRKGRVCILEVGLVGLLQLPAGKGAGPAASRFAAPELVTKPSSACDVFSLASIARHLVGNVGQEPKNWQNALQRAMHPDPERRFRTCGDFVAEMKGSVGAKIGPPESRVAVPGEPGSTPPPAEPKGKVVQAPAAEVEPSAVSARLEVSMCQAAAAPFQPSTNGGEADEAGKVLPGGAREASSDDSQVLPGEIPFSIIPEDKEGFTGQAQPQGDAGQVDKRNAPRPEPTEDAGSPEEQKPLADLEPSQEPHPDDQDGSGANVVSNDAASIEEAGEEDNADRQSELVHHEDLGDPEKIPEIDATADWAQERAEIDFPRSDDEDVDGDDDDWAAAAGRWPAIQPFDVPVPNTDGVRANAPEFRAVAESDGDALQSAGRGDYATAQLENPPLPHPSEIDLEMPVQPDGTLLSVSLSSSPSQLYADPAAAPADSPSALLKRLEIDKPTPEKIGPSVEVVEDAQAKQAFVSSTLDDDQRIDIEGHATCRIPTDQLNLFVPPLVLPDDDQRIDIDFGATRVIPGEPESPPLLTSLEGIKPQSKGRTAVVKDLDPTVQESTRSEARAPELAPVAQPSSQIDVLDQPIDMLGGATRVLPEKPEPEPVIPPADPRQYTRVVPTLPARKPRGRKKQKKSSGKNYSPATESATTDYLPVDAPPDQPETESAEPRNDHTVTPSLEGTANVCGPLLATANQDCGNGTSSDAANPTTDAEGPQSAEPILRLSGMSPVILSEALRAHVAQVRAALFTNGDGSLQTTQSAPQGSEAARSDLTVIELAPVPVTGTNPASASAEAAPADAEDMAGTRPILVDSTPAASLPPAGPENPGELPDDLSLTRTQNSVPIMTETLKARKVRSARVRSRLVREHRPDLGLSNETMTYPGPDLPSDATSAPAGDKDPWLAPHAPASPETDGSKSPATEACPLGLNSPLEATALHRDTQPQLSPWADSSTAGSDQDFPGSTQTGDLQASDWNKPGAAGAAATMPGSPWSWSSSADSTGERGAEEYVSPPWEEVLAGQSLPLTRSSPPGTAQQPGQTTDAPEDPSMDREALARALAAQVVANMMDDAQQTDLLDAKADPWQSWQSNESASGSASGVVVEKHRFEPGPRLARLLEDAARLMPEPEPEVWTTMPDGRKQLTCSFPASLPPGVSATAFDGFRRQWNADLKSSDSTGVIFYIGPSTGFWQRWLGRSAGVLVDIRWLRAPEVAIPRVNVVLRSAGRSNDQSLEELGPLLMDSLRAMLLGPSNRRSERRLIWPHPVQLTFLLSSGEVSGVVEGLGKDVNRIGAGIYLPRILPGSQVQVQFQNPENPGSGPVRVLGRFIRVNRYGQDWFEVAALFEQNIEDDMKE